MPDSTANSSAPENSTPRNSTLPKAVTASAHLPRTPPSAIVSCFNNKHTIDACYLYRDHADTPVRGVPYRLTLKSDRSLFVEGTTDDQGRLHAEVPLGGRYELTFIPQQDSQAQQQAEALRKALKQTLNDIIINAQQNTRYQEQVLAELHWAEKALIYSGAALQGIGDSVTSFGEFIVAVGTALNDAQQAYLDLWGHIVTGNFDEIERIIENHSAAAERFFQASDETFEKLVLLVSDRTVRQALYDFPQRYWEALSPVEQTRALAGIGTDIALEVLIAAVSGGTAVPAQLAKLGHTSTGLLNKVVNILSELASVLKKIQPRRQKIIASNTRKTFYVDHSADNRLRLNHGGSSRQPGVNDANKPTASIDNTPLSGEPISMVTGEEILQLTDFQLPGLLPLAWTRVYRSGNDRHQGLGFGWTHPFCEQLAIDNEQVIYSDAEGRHIPFPLPDVGEFSVNETEGIFLHREYPQIYVIRQKAKPDKHFTGEHMAPLQAISDQRGNAWNCLYHPQTGELIGLTSSWGTELVIHREQGNIRRITFGQTLPTSQPALTLATYDYDTHNDLITATDRSQHPEHYHYKNHILTQRTLKSGYRFHLRWDQYDKYGKCIEQWGDQGNYHYRFQWNEAQRVSTSIDSNGGVLEIHYNQAGLITKEVSPAGHITLFEYDDCQRLIKKTNPNGHAFEYRYNNTGNLTACLDPAGGGYAITYDSEQNPTEYSDALGNTWLTDWNEQGLVTKTTTPEGFETRYFYNRHGLPVTIIQPDGNKRYLQWDDQGNLVADSQQTAHYQHNALGQITRISQGAKETTYQYDSSGHLTDIHYPDGRQLHMAYNSSGQLVQYIDGAGHTTRFEYDGLSQVTQRINALGHGFHYHYDSERNLVGLTNEKGERYQLTYDADERLIKETGFDGRTQQYQYDPAGYLIQQIEGDHEDATDLAANTTVFHRDPLGRLIQKQCPDGDTINFVFNANGQLTEAINTHRTLQFAYTPSGHLAKETQDTHTLTHQYDHFGNRTATQLPSGEVIGYQHDHSGYLTAIDFNGACISQYQRDADGRTTAQQQGDLISQWDYDPAGRIAQHRVTNGQSKQPIIQRHYQYDPAGNLQQLHDAHKGSTHYHYNALNQLTTVDGYINEQFAFDPAGNITQGQPASSGNRLAFYGDKHYQYDPRGNVIEERRGKHQQLITRYCYNSQNQLTAVEKNGQQFTYRYDALGRRISKKDAFGETHFLWNGDVLLSETRKNHQKLYIYESNSFKPLAHIENNQCYFYHLDHLGTPQEITDWAGHIVWSGKYKAYGNLALKPVEEVENNLRFQGQYYDEETGLHYNRHRYYDPGIGQFISQDPIGLLGGFNSYQYAANPIQWIDPLGLTAQKEDPARTRQALQKAKPDFYVGPAGPEATMPATGYRYMRYKNDDGSVNKYANMTMQNKSAPTTYIGFEKYETGSEARDAFQIKGPEFGSDENGEGSWSDARLRGEFGTLQLYEEGDPKVRIPFWAGDKDKSKLEPFAEAYPQYGQGGAIQMQADGRKIEFDNVDILPEN